MIEKVLIDTNVLIYLLNDKLELHSKALDMYMGMVGEGSSGVINSYVLNELHYFYLRTIDSKKAQFGLNQALKLPGIEYRDVEFGVADVEKMSDLSIKYNLKTFDAYHVHFCEKLGIKKVATYDEDFKKVKSLKVVG